MTKEYLFTSEPVSLTVDLHGTGEVAEKKLANAVRNGFRLSLGGIIDMLDPRRPIYRENAVYGHFDRELAEFTGERIG